MVDKTSEEKPVVCRIKKLGELVEIECEIDEKKERMYCIFGQKGKTGGLSLFGFGCQYGIEEQTFECFSEEDIKSKIARKLSIKNIELIWDD